MNTTLKKKTEEKNSIPRTEYSQRSGEQIDGNTLKEFFLACFTRTLRAGLRSPFDIKPCICFYTKVHLSNLIICINTLIEEICLGL